MKHIFKTLPVIALGILSFTLASCKNDDEPIDPFQLPDNAQIFIADYFGGENIKDVYHDEKDNEYEATINNGFEITFDQDGNWISVDAPEGMTIPAGIAPAPIESYVETNYPGEGINEIEKSNNYYVELTNDVDLIFNLNGEFISLGN